MGIREGGIHSHPIGIILNPADSAKEILPAFGSLVIRDAARWGLDLEMRDGGRLGESWECVFRECKVSGGRQRKQHVNV